MSPYDLFREDISYVDSPPKQDFTGWTFRLSHYTTPDGGPIYLGSPPDPESNEGGCFDFLPEEATLLPPRLRSV